jgi:AcrR family transcriptional regulator
VSTRPSTPDTRRRRDTRSRLVAAAYEVFAEYGVQAATIEIICDRAGYTRGAFYSNFGTKEDLLFALIDREQQRHLERLERVLQGAVAEFKETIGNDLAAAIRLVLDAFIEINPPDRTSFMVERELELLAARDPQVARMLSKSREGAYASLAQVLATALEQVGRRPVLSPVDLAKLIWATYEFTLQETFSGEKQANKNGGLAARTLPTLVASLTEPA